MNMSGLKCYYGLNAVMRIRIRDPVTFLPLDPGSGMGFFGIPDFGSQDHILKSFLTSFGKKFYNSLKISTNFFLWQFKTEIIYNFVKFGGNIKRFNISFFFTSLFCCCFSGINIPDPQHCSASMKSKIGCSHSSCPWWPSDDDMVLVRIRYWIKMRIRIRNK